MQVELEELQPQLVETAAENEKMLTVCRIVCFVHLAYTFMCNILQ